MLVPKSNIEKGKVMKRIVKLLLFGIVISCHMLLLRAMQNSDVAQALRDNKDLYAVLGVTSDVSQDTIVKQYRKLSLVYHPDKPSGSTAKMQELNFAYSILQNPILRQQYDQGRRSAGNGTKPVQKELSISDLIKSGSLSKEIPANGIVNLSNKGLTDLSGLETMEGLERLTSFILDGNKLKNIPAYLFDKMIHLKNLSLIANQLEVFPASLLVEKLPALNCLNLTFNKKLKERDIKDMGYCHKKLQELRETIQRKYYPEMKSGR